MKRDDTTKITTRRVGGYLHRVIPILDEAGNVISHALKPFMVEFHPRDVMQVIVGASILAVPVAFTEETWKLGQELPLLNVITLSSISFCFISLFVYFNLYRHNLKDHLFEYIKRVFFTYVLSLMVVGLLLTIIERCPWTTDPVIAIKRILIVAFPASMSAALSDVLK